MILIHKEVIEANVSNLVLSIIENDWTKGVEYCHLKEDLEEALRDCLHSHSIYYISEKEK